MIRPHLIAEAYHGTTTNYGYGCRCNACVEAAADRHRAIAARGIGADDPRHGTKNGYSNLGCRCTACCAANTARQRSARLKLRAGEYPPTVRDHLHVYQLWLPLWRVSRREQRSARSSLQGRACVVTYVSPLFAKFASGAPRPTPQSPEMVPPARLRRTLASRTRTALEGDRAADGFPRPSAAPDLNTQEA